MQYYIEKRFRLTNKNILGIDEAGRGNLAGPLVVAGCILKLNEIPNKYLMEINDSKKLSKNKREILSEIIKKYSNFKIEVIDVKTVNDLGPKKAAILGMERVINSIEKFADLILVDFEKPKSTKRLINLIHGDKISINIAAASILAKTFKDKIMLEFVKQNPKYSVYDFINNAGYGTKKHLEAIKKYGIIKDFHRINYLPIKNILNKKE